MVKVNVIGAIGPFPFPPTQRALWVGVGLPPALPPISRIRAPPEIGEMGGLQSGKPLGGKPLGGSHWVGPPRGALSQFTGCDPTASFFSSRSRV